jgi:hypothetical protein
LRSAVRLTAALRQTVPRFLPVVPSAQWRRQDGRSRVPHASNIVSSVSLQCVRAGAVVAKARAFSSRGRRIYQERPSAVGRDQRQPVQLPENQVPACLPVRDRGGHAIARRGGGVVEGGSSGCGLTGPLPLQGTTDCARKRSPCAGDCMKAMPLFICCPMQRLRRMGREIVKRLDSIPRQDHLHACSAVGLFSTDSNRN